MSEFKVIRNDYGITIIPSNYFATRSGHDREEITLRIASITKPCNECYNDIKKGDKYIRDIFFFKDAYRGYYSRFTKTHTNWICLSCWKGQIPKRVTRNKKRKHREDN